MTEKNLLNELREYCRLAGLKPSTVCVRALGDSRFVARHERRLVQMQKDADRLRAYMAANPTPKQNAEAS